MPPSVIDIVREVYEGWQDDSEYPVTDESWLVKDLCFSSMDLVMLVVEIRQRLGRNDIPFERLFAPAGRYRSDVQVKELEDFVYRMRAKVGDRSPAEAL